MPNGTEISSMTLRKPPASLPRPYGLGYLTGGHATSGVEPFRPNARLRFVLRIPGKSYAHFIKSS